MDGSTSLPAQLDQIDEFKARFDHLSSFLPLRMLHQYTTDGNRFKQYSLQTAGLDYSKNRINSTTIKLPLGENMPFFHLSTPMVVES